MRPIEQSRSAEIMSAAADLSYEDVRQSFLTRLHGEQSRLATLEIALGSAGDDPASAFLDLESFAHRLRGAAAVFDFPGLRDDSKDLELAAGDAAIRLAPSGEPHVQKAMRMLSNRLTRLNGDTPPADAALALASAN